MVVSAHPWVRTGGAGAANCSSGLSELLVVISELVTCSQEFQKEMYKKYPKLYSRASLVAQWLRIHLPMQGTQV